MKNAVRFFQFFTITMCFALTFTACEQPSGGGNSPRPSTPSSPTGTGGGEPQTVTLTFDLDGGNIGGKTENVTLTGKSGAALVTPHPVKDGYDLSGWKPAAPAKFPTSSTTYKAQWTERRPDEVSLTLDLHGGTGIEPFIKGEENSSVTPPQNPTRRGYDFQKWEPALPATFTKQASTKQYVAVWKAKSVTYTFYSDESKTSVYTTLTGDHDTNVTRPDAPAPDLATRMFFDKWEPELPEKFDVDTTTEYVAKYKFVPNENVVLTLKLEGGTLPAGQDEHPHGKQGDPLSVQNPTKKGYTFKGWNTVGGTLPATFPATNETYTAQWEAKTYAVKYNSNGGGTAPADTSRTYGQAFTLATSAGMSKTGHDFAGWEKDNAGTAYGSGANIADTALTQIDGDITFWAEWTPHTYSVTYNTNGATSGSPSKTTDTHVYGREYTLTARNDLQKTGYTFKGWTTTSDGSGTVYTAGATTSDEAIKNRTSDITFYAKWEILIDALYVSASGSDSNIGTKESPFLTLAKAFEVASNCPTDTTVTLLSNISINTTASVTGGNISFDGKNYSIYRSSSTFTDAMITIDGGNIALQNVTLDGGKESGILATKSILDVNGGIATMKNDVYIKNNKSNSGGGVRVKQGTFIMTGGEISGNEAYGTGGSEGHGGGVYVRSSGTFEMSGTATIKNNTALRGGGILSFGMVKITGGYIKENVAILNGGGVYFASPETVSMTGGEISGNTANGTGEQEGRGGGVYLSSGTFEMSGTAVIKNNTAQRQGGGIASWGKITMTGGEISGNTANGTGEQEGRGGGIYFGNSGTFEMSGTAVIKGNKSKTNGGGVYFGSPEIFSMTGGEISGNTANGTGEYDGRGGGICLNSSGTFEMSGTAAIKNNTAQRQGGGIASWVKITMTGGEISGNTTETYEGGGIYFGNSGTFEMSGTAVIKGNKSKTNGGGVYFASPETFSMTGGEISGNTANGTGEYEGRGGGVYLSSSGTFEMSGTAAIKNNTAQRYGGGIASWGKITMTGGEISENTTETYQGGGVYFGNSGTFEMSGTAIIKGNKSKTNGGGVYFGSPEIFSMAGGEISGNTANNGDGGGIYISGSGILTMTNSTISTNRAHNGGGVYFASTGKFTMSGGSIKNNNVNDTGYAGDGGGVYVAKDGTFEMVNKAIVSSNYAYHAGGGVYVNGYFNMKDSEIRSNSVHNELGGGIFIGSGTAVMDSGKVANNSYYGVYISSGTFEINGGSVYGETILEGSVANSRGKFIKNGGSVQEYVPPQSH